MVDLGPCTVVHLNGEIDLQNADELRAELSAAVGYRQAGETLQIDLGAVTFMDASGLGALATAYHAANGCGVAVALVNVPGQVKRVLELSGLDTLFDTVIPLNHAPSAPPPASLDVTL